MIKVEHRSKLQGAEKFGSCASCGKERDVYKVSFEDLHNNCTSVSLCFACLTELGNIAYEEYQKETDFIKE